MEHPSAVLDPPIVVVGSSLGPESDSIVRMGLAITRSANGRAVVVHVLEPRTRVARGLLDYPMVRDGLVAAAREKVVAQLRRIGAAARDVADLAIDLPPVHVALLGAAERWRATLLVVGANSDRSTSPRLGSSAARLLCRSRRPLWLVKRCTTSLPSVVLVPIPPSIPSTALEDSLKVLGRLVPAVATEVIPADEDGALAGTRAELLLLRRPSLGERADRLHPDRALLSLVRGVDCSVLIVPAPPTLAATELPTSLEEEERESSGKAYRTD